MGDGEIGLVNITLSNRFGGTGPAKLVAVAPNTGTECSDVNTVIFLGDQRELPPLSVPPDSSVYKVVINTDGEPVYSEGRQPVAP